MLIWAILKTIGCVKFGIWHQWVFALVGPRPPEEINNLMANIKRLSAHLFITQWPCLLRLCVPDTPQNSWQMAGTQLINKQYRREYIKEERKEEEEGETKSKYILDF